jgi:asparagine synthase (glutamine-hydrolysing)
MFAFAIWDSRCGEVFLARDHLGIKPLYYVELGERVLFASEIKALLEDKSFSRDVDLDALAELFTFRYVPSPKTLFKQIRKLPPGHTMTLSTGAVAIRRFWNWTPKLRRFYNEPALIEEYQGLLEDAVRLQLRSDVSLGLFLSSGVDSGVLLSIMTRYSSRPVKAFTIGFEGGDKTNEVEDARALATRFGADHHVMMIGPEDYLGYYEKYLWDLEEPVGNETAAAFYFVSRMASQAVKVALTGQGADEPWAGYHRYIGARLSTVYSRLPRVVTDPIAAAMTRIPARLERAKRGALSLAEPDILTRFAKIYSFFSEDMKGRLFKGPMIAQIVEDACKQREALYRLQRDVANLDPLTQMLYIDTRASLPDDLLMVGDKTSMANSLEARVPFLDYRLVEFVESLPPRLKLRRLRGKYLHKKASQKWLPREVVYRRKKGFANPIEWWFRTRLRHAVEEYLLGPNSAIGDYFDQAYVRQMLERDRSGRDDLRRHIYLLVSFEMWHRTFIRARV